MAVRTKVIAFFWCMYVLPNIRKNGDGKSVLDDEEEGLESANKTGSLAEASWASDGCPKQNEGQVENFARSEVETAAVRCCSLDGETCETSGLSTDPDCGDLQNLERSEAIEICEAKGMRLCTRQQLESNMCCNSGCGFDGVLVWEGVSSWASDGCPKQNTGQVENGARSEVETAAVRCCSHDGQTCETSGLSTDPNCGDLQNLERSEAIEICEAKGMRLCTRQQLESDMCCNSGCGFDGVLVWEGDSPTWELITCPVLAALFREGDLVPDIDGRVKRSEVVAAFEKVQIPEDIINATVAGNFDHLFAIEEDPSIDIFTMSLEDPLNPPPSKNVEHTESTGIRDPGPPNAEIYAKFETFLGGTSTWTESCMDDAIAHFEVNTNDRGTMGSLGAIKAMARAFGTGDGTISQDDMKLMFMESRYPESFKTRIGL